MLLLGNVEARFPLFWIVSGAVFLDAGNVWERPEDITLESIRPYLRPMPEGGAVAGCWAGSVPVRTRATRRPAAGRSDTTESGAWVGRI